MTVAVALSGGADSLLALLLLRDAGENVFGVHLELNPLWNGLWNIQFKLQKRNLSIGVRLHRGNGFDASVL